MATENPTTITCPTQEELSVFYDQPSDNTIAEHVAACEKCHQTLATFYQLERLTSELASPPAGLAERINAAVLRAPTSKPAPRVAFWQWHNLQQAASWILVAVLGSLWLLSYTQRDNQDSAVAVSEQLSLTASTQNATTQLQKIETPLPDDGFSLIDQLKLKGNVDVGDLRKVSTGMQVNQSYSDTRQYAIGSRIRHIWLTENLANSRSILEEAAKMSSCKIDWKSDEKADTHIAILTASDKNIQKLVNILYARNLQLLSPTYPQPQAEHKASFTGNAMQYQVVLVQKE